MTLNITLISPTRCRPSTFADALGSALNMARDPKSLEVLVRLDYDDQRLHEYLSRVPMLCPWARLVIGPRLTVGAAAPLNDLVQSARGDAIVCFSDDNKFLTPRWDDEVRRVLENNPKKLIFFPKDNYLDEKQATNFIVRRKWVEIMGFLLPPQFNHLYADTWVEDVAKKADVLHYMPEIIIQHEKFANPDLTMIDTRLGLQVALAKVLFDASLEERNNYAAIIKRELSGIEGRT